MILFPDFFEVPGLFGRGTEIVYLAGESTVFEPTVDRTPAAVLLLLAGTAVFQILPAAPDLVFQRGDETVPAFRDVGFSQADAKSGVSDEGAEACVAVRVNVEITSFADAGSEKTVIRPGRVTKALI